MDKKEYQKQYRLKNREKIKEQRKQYYEKNKDKILSQKRQLYNPEKAKNNRLQQLYGISLESYNEMLISQNYKCFCCGAHQDSLKTPNNQYGTKRLVVDHDHETGEVRKLLCSRCNTVIGMVEEDVTILSQMEKYLAECLLEKERVKRSSGRNQRVPDATETGCSD